VTFEEQYEYPGSMQWRKGTKKGAKKGGKRERQPGGFTVTLFRVLFRSLFFFDFSRIAGRIPFFSVSYPFCTSNWKREKKTGRKTKRMAKRAKKGGGKKANCEQP
jgi:hypothetical protein